MHNFKAYFALLQKESIFILQTVKDKHFDMINDNKAEASLS